MVKRGAAGTLPALMVLAMLVAAAPARAETCTVGDAACPTLAEALRAAEERPGEDRVRLPAGEVEAGDAAYESDDALQLTGQGIAETRVTGHLSVGGERVMVRGFSLVAGEPVVLEAAGHVRAIRVTGEAEGGVAIRALPGAPLQLDDAVIDATGVGAALEARCSTLRARHVTVAGDGLTGARAGCGEPEGSALVSLDSSIVAAGYPRALLAETRGSARAAYSNLAGTVEGDVAEPVAGDPGFVSATDLRLAPGSPLIERGNPAPLTVDRPAPGEPDVSEPMEDLDGAVRIADGDADGRARRDVGAYEAAPPAPFGVPTGNLLVNPDAESAEPGPPPGWTVTGGFTTVSYGTPLYPSAISATALGGGSQFFFADGTGPPPPGGAPGDATATQVIDITGRHAAVDTGEGRATLSGLLGGYRADADRLAVRAMFHGPSGITLGGVELEPVDAAARGNATNLLARTASVPLPALTRTIEVRLSAVKGPGGSYTDAYFDNLGLVLELPGGPDGPGDGGDDGGDGDPGPRPFAGILVLSGEAVLSRRTGRAKVLVACASATVARCTGDLTLQAVLVRRAPRVVIGRARVSLAPGGARRVGVRFSRAAKAYLRRHSKLRVRVGTEAVDGQGVRRATTVPISVRPQRGGPRRRDRR